MTNANRISERRNQIFAPRFHNSRQSNHPIDKSAPRVSVGFETGSKYARRTPQIIIPAKVSEKRRAYISPNADVILMPTAIEQAAAWELLSKEEEAAKKERISLKEKLKKATHRESETYTLYGVETRELFTEEIEIDIVTGAAFDSVSKFDNNTNTDDGSIQSDVCRADSGDLSSRRSAAAEKISRMRSEMMTMFKNFIAK